MSQIGSAVFSFASVWLVNKTLGAEGYGKVVAVIAASQAVQVFVNWTATSVVRFGTEEFVETRRIARAFWLRLFILVPNFTLVLLASRLWFPSLADWLKLSAESFWLLILHFAATALWLHVQMSLQSAKLPRVQGFLVMLERLLIFVGLAVLLDSGSLNPSSALICYALAPLLMTAVGIFFLRHFIFARFSVNWRFIKKIAAYSLPLLPFSLVGYLSGNYIDAIFISEFLSTRDLGIYSVAYQITGILMQFPMLAGTLLLPLFVTLETKKNIEKVKGYMEDVLPIITLFGGLAGIFAAFLASFFLRFGFNEEHNNIAVIFGILVSSATFAMPGFIGYVPYVNSLSVTYIFTINAIIAAVVNVTANMVLVPVYGLKGCAWGTVLAYGISFLAVSLIIKKKFSIKQKWLIPAIAPSVLGSVCASWTENFFLSFALAFTTTFVVILTCRKSFIKSVNALINYRSLIAKG